MSKSNIDFLSEPFFSHEINASNNFKIKKLIRKYGNEGYGIFWRLIEQLASCNESEFKLYWDNDTIELLADSFRIEESYLIEFVEFCLNLQPKPLLYFENGYLFSNSLIKRMAFTMQKKVVHSVISSAGGTQSGISRATISDVKKDEVINAIETKPNTYPTLEDLELYLNSPAIRKLDSDNYLLNNNKHSLYLIQMTNKGWKAKVKNRNTNEFDLVQIDDWKTHFAKWLVREQKYRESNQNNEPDTNYLDDD